MKKIFLCVILVISLVIMSSVAFASQKLVTAPNIKVIVDGESFTGVPMIENGKILLPLKSFLSSIGVLDKGQNVIWNKVERSITIKSDSTKVYMKLGSEIALVNNKQINMGAASFINKNNRVYIPAKFIAEIFGKNVAWEAKKNSLIINTSNKEKAIAVLKSLETGDEKAIKKWINPNKYIQHNLAFPSGREVMLGALGQLKQAGTKVNIKRVIVDGDYVVLHTDYNFFGPKAGFDIFRFEDGKIVEHWDNLQEKVDQTPSGHTMFDGTATIKDLTKTEANKALVKDFVKNILVEGQFNKLNSYFNGDNYIQHNPAIPDGLSGLGKALEEMAQQGITMKYDKIHMVLGQGNFVLAVSEGSFAGKHTSFYDLFRVENGKIAEHWDVMESILPQDQWKNQNGKF